jgi:hypothetical protein
MNIEEYKSFDATGLANLVKKGEVTAIELLELAMSIVNNSEKKNIGFDNSSI